jgi:aromatase
VTTGLTGRATPAPPAGAIGNLRPIATEANVSEGYLSLEALAAVVREKTGVDVDVAELAARPATVSELGIDSLGWLGVFSTLENQYGIALEASAESVTNLPDLVVLVNNALNGGKKVGHTDNRVVIAAPLDLVWSMTNDVESWTSLFSEYGEAVILDRAGDTVTFRLSTVPDAQGTVYSWVSERTPDRDALAVKARRVETGVFDFMNINWMYREVDDGVEMRWIQDFAMKPDAPVNDDQMTDYINRNSVLQMTRIKALVERAAAEMRVA